MIINNLLNYLADNGIGTVNENIFEGELPFDTDDCIALMYSPSPEPNKSIPYFNQTIDVWGRFSDYDDGMTKLKAVFDLFHRQDNWDISGFHIYLSYANGMIDDLDRDSKRRHLFKTTYTFVYREGPELS